MDPELVAALNDQLRTLNDTLGSLNTMTTRSANTATSFSSTVSNSSKSIAANSKITEANTEFQSKASKAAASLESALYKSKDAFQSLGNALLDVNTNTVKYAASIKSASGAVSDLAMAFGAVGLVVGTLAKTFGGLAGMTLKYQDSLVAGFDDMAKVTGGFGESAKGILDLAHQAGFSSQNLAIFTKHAREASEQLVGMGGSVSGGVKAYAQFVDIVKSDDAAR